MPITTQEAIVERRVNLADWTTAIMSMFWSVWWGFFANHILDSLTVEVSLPIEVAPFVSSPFRITKTGYLITNAFVASAFAFTYVRWLWDAQKYARRGYLATRLVASSITFGFTGLILLGSVGYIGLAFGVPEPLMFYGIILTVVWPAIVLITLWRA